MTITPTPFAEAAANRLAEVLIALHQHYLDEGQTAERASLDGDLDRARQICADGQFITDEVCRILEPNCPMSNWRVFVDGIEDAITEVVGTNELNFILDESDPERLARQAAYMARLAATQ
jgi:hypothetical protein